MTFAAVAAMPAAGLARPGPWGTRRYANGEDGTSAVGLMPSGGAAGPLFTVENSRYLKPRDFRGTAMAEIVHLDDDPFHGELRAVANRDGFVVIEMKEERDAPFLVLSALEAARLMTAMRAAIAGIDTDVKKALPPED